VCFAAPLLVCANEITVSTARKKLLSSLDGDDRRNRKRQTASFQTHELKHASLHTEWWSSIDWASLSLSLQVWSCVDQLRGTLQKGTFSLNEITTLVSEEDTLNVFVVVRLVIYVM